MSFLHCATRKSFAMHLFGQNILRNGIISITPLLIPGNTPSKAAQLKIDSNILTRLLPPSQEAQGTFFHLPLPDGSVVSLRTEYAEVTADGYALYGVQPDNSAVYAFLGITGDNPSGFHMAGSLYLEGRCYVIDPAGAGLVTVSIVQQLAEIPGNSIATGPVPVSTGESLPLQSTGEDEPSTAEIAVLALYPPALETAIGRLFQRTPRGFWPGGFASQA